MVGYRTGDLPECSGDDVDGAAKALAPFAEGLRRGGAEAIVARRLRTVDAAVAKAVAAAAAKLPAVPCFLVGADGTVDGATVAAARADRAAPNCARRGSGLRDGLRDDDAGTRERRKNSPAGARPSTPRSPLET